MNLRTAGSIAALAGSMLASPASFAVAYSTASVGNFTVTLTDLDLTDGITPYFQLSEQAAPHYVSTEYKADNNARTVFAGRNTSTWQPIAIEALYEAPAGGTERFSAAASMAGSTLPALQVDTSASAAGNAQLGYSMGSAQIWDRFTLSPNTGLSVSFDLSVGSALSDPAGPGGAYSWSTVEFVGSNFNTQAFRKFHRVGYGDPTEGTAGTATHTFDLTSDSREFLVTAMISAGSVGSNVNNLLPPPVPEPATYAMLLAGFGVIGASAVRRRKRRQGKC